MLPKESWMRQYEKRGIPRRRAFFERKQWSKSLESGTLQNGKNPPGLESRDNRSQIEAAHGAFKDVTHCRNASGEDETWANLRREVSAWNQCKERQKLLTENLRAPRELPPRRPTTSRYYIGVSCRKRVPFRNPARGIPHTMKTYRRQMDRPHRK